MAIRPCRWPNSAPMRWWMISRRCPELFPVWCLEICRIGIALARRTIEIEQDRFHEALGREGILIAIGKDSGFGDVDFALVVDEHGPHQIAVLHLHGKLAAVMTGLARFDADAFICQYLAAERGQKLHFQIEVHRIGWAF